MKYTMEDIARMAGVSRGTVNRAIYGKTGINEETRKKILDLIAEVGYFPDRAAQSLVKGRSNAVGLVLHNMSNEFNIMMYDYVQKLCIERNYYLHFTSSNSNPLLEAQNIQRLIEYNVDGIIIFPIDRRGEMLRLAMSKGIAVVQILNLLPDIAAHSITVNEYGLVKQATQRLLDLGHRRVVFVEAMFGEYLSNLKAGSGRYNRYVYEERIRGYLDAMNEAGIATVRSDIPIFYEDRHTQDGAKGFTQDLVKKYDPTALMCYDDFTAIWMMTGLKKLKIRVPEDISIIGFDNINTLKFIEPALSTIRVDYSEIARRAGQILFEEIDHPGNLQQIELDGEYIEQASVVPLPKA